MTEYRMTIHLPQGQKVEYDFETQDELDKELKLYREIIAGDYEPDYVCGVLGGAPVFLISPNAFKNGGAYVVINKSSKPWIGAVVIRG